MQLLVYQAMPNRVTHSIRFALWVLMVLTDRLIWAAMAVTDMPATSSCNTSNSRVERVSCGTAGHGAQGQLFGRLGADIAPPTGIILLLPILLRSAYFTDI